MLPDTRQAPFTDAFVRIQDRLRRLLAGLGLGTADVDDVLQEVFVAAAARPGADRGPAAAEGWIVRAAVNAAMLERRRERRFRAHAERVGRFLAARREPAGGGHDEAVRAEEIEAVRAAVAGLPEELAVPLALRYAGGYDATAIGALLELPPGTVRSRLRRARLLLAESLEHLR